MLNDISYKLASKIQIVSSHFPAIRSLAREACNILMCGKERIVNIDVESAYEKLNSVHKDVKSSAICNNVIKEPKYDLQIIVPVYNVEKQLEGCIKSVLTQKTHYTFLLVIINDGSPDNSDEIIKKYEDDERVKVIRQENKGFSGARNAGLSQIEARYVMFVDSDDALCDNAIETLMQTAYEDDADIVEGNYVRIKRGGGKVINLNTTQHLNASVKLGQPWGKVFKAEIFHEICFPEKYWFEDTIGAFLLYPLSQRVSTVSMPVYQYLINPHGISATSKGRSQSLDTVYITEALLKDSATIGILEKCKQQLYEHMFNQMRTNFCRTVDLGEEVRRSVFVVHYELVDRYFKGCQTQYENNKSLECAIRKRDYKEYTICCLSS